ncbi:type I-E CRISPR-associated protein Cas6/Cse3/CasE [Methanocella sp. CWC-04]|uniref:Type I-E CRISPR-associated protein Cas6/Cse3/CasE n=1 Tax=Methanooceanicella nereidis TaxID=2052831 RepID=A0AAP2RCK1_9EURY|nr:type I-E CRISPR-associated protein Cas6/Cse3/CasE [Methanocella sp. CWC-04]MCD1294789.1 type I-E CRISPR-associated protein Cas6/Cse3/CasE [Methanocella sp. CWC-04]
MYLSRLILNPGNKAVRRDLADCQELHRTVLGGYPDLNEEDADAREKFGVLHRLDIHPRSGAIVLLVQSLVNPDWSSLPAGYLLIDTDLENPACKQISEQYGGIKSGDVFTFRLRANPTKKVGTSRVEEIKLGKPKSNGKRVPLKNEAEQISWLKRKGDHGGFELIAAKAIHELADVLVKEESPQKGAYLKGNQCSNGTVNNRLSFVSVLYEGKLIVTDACKFQDTLKAGIGSGKAYGFGLLSIASARGD